MIDQAVLGEFIGTLILILLGNGVVANVVLARTKGHDGGWITIAVGWGMAVFVAVWCVQDYSGAHINPAVTIGLALAGEFAWASVGPYIVAQILGALAGAGLVLLFYYEHFAATDDVGLKLACFSTGPAIRRPWNNFVSEVIGTVVLVFGVLQATSPTLSPATASTTDPSHLVGLGTIGAIPVGLLVLAIGLSLGGTTGYAINPARDFGPRLAHQFLPVPSKGASDWAYAWIPIVGPIVGAVAAVMLSALFGTVGGS